MVGTNREIGSLIISILTIVFFFSPVQSVIGQDLSGKYFHESGEMLSVDKDTLFYINTIGERNDTMAKCLINKINDEFIELQSYPNMYNIVPLIEVKQWMDSTIHKGTLLEFDLHLDNRKVTIIIKNDRGMLSRHILLYSGDKRSILLPSAKTDFVLSSSIHPLKLHPARKRDGSFTEGYSYFPPRFKINKECNRVKISIPLNSYFDRFEIIGDYARIGKGQITWRGNSFKKVTATFNE